MSEEKAKEKVLAGVFAASDAAKAAIDSISAASLQTDANRDAALFITGTMLLQAIATRPGVDPEMAAMATAAIRATGLHELLSSMPPVLQ